jgi:hypothetical protein
MSEAAGRDPLTLYFLTPYLFLSCRADPDGAERLTQHVISSERSKSRDPLQSTKAVCRWAVRCVLWARRR